MTLEERWERLEPFMKYGPGYVRGVRENVSDARRFHGWEPGGFSEEYFTLRAELLAKLITFEKFETAKAFAQGKLL